MSVSPKEISAGLILHLDPDEFEASGAIFNCDPAARVQGAHFFVCLWTNGVKSRWLPLYRDDGTGRVEIPSSDRSGHQRWMSPRAFYCPSQVWVPTTPMYPLLPPQGATCRACCLGIASRQPHSRGSSVRQTAVGADSLAGVAVWRPPTITVQSGPCTTSAPVLLSQLHSLSASIGCGTPADSVSGESADAPEQ